MAFALQCFIVGFSKVLKRLLNGQGCPRYSSVAKLSYKLSFQGVLCLSSDISRRAWLQIMASRWPNFAKCNSLDTPDGAIVQGQERASWLSIHCLLCKPIQPSSCPTIGDYKLKNCQTILVNWQRSLLPSKPWSKSQNYSVVLWAKLGKICSKLWLGLMASWSWRWVSTANYAHYLIN